MQDLGEANTDNNLVTQNKDQQMIGLTVAAPIADLTGTLGASSVKSSNVGGLTSIGGTTTINGSSSSETGSAGIINGGTLTLGSTGVIGTNGTETLSLAGSNSYTGGTTINSGTLTVVSVAHSGPITLYGGTLNFLNQHLGNLTVIADSLSVTNDNGTITVTASIPNGTIDLAAFLAHTQTLTISNNGNAISFTPRGHDGTTGVVTYGGTAYDYAVSSSQGNTIVLTVTPLQDGATEPAADGGPVLGANTTVTSGVLTLDLTNSKLIVETPPALGNLTLSGGNITSASAGAITFGGLVVDSNSILIAPDVLGNATVGTINTNNLQLVLNHFGSNSTPWITGNFDAAPTISLNDLNVVLNNMTIPSPEPVGGSYVIVTSNSLVPTATTAPDSAAFTIHTSNPN